MNKINSSDSNGKLGGFNVIIISIISFLYILLFTKLAEIISSHLSDNDNETQIGTYVMIIYFVSIIGIIIGYIWFGNNSDKNVPNWIIRWSLSISGVLMLIYTIINYWEYLGDYSKVILIFLSIVSIIYYLYKYY
jgi:hypothetical protein